MEFKQLDTWLKLADENLAESIKHRAKNLKNGKLYETDAYMIYTVGVDNEDAHLNGVFCLDDTYAEEMLEKANDIFKTMNRNYVVWVREHGNLKLEKILKEKGLKAKREPGSSGMIIKQRIAPVEIPRGFEIKRVTTSKEAEDFSVVVQNAFEKPIEVAQEVFSSVETLFSPNVISYVVYQKDHPVASVTTVVSGRVAGIYWVGTVEEARGQGLGSYITYVATNAGFDAGAEAVILQASIAGERVYKKLGYETITHYRWYPIDV
ncbi:acetyltransferase, GNAT family [Gottschalkia purinilytica]|uniref:Acetyltransferase, GNAT family n=1 Tax=Gottschalkia purinilytica TaxID=1503 RepID=A0A0L0W716_GOTPU|nr:GNAT family N-acetyltransferase [Gottschalkia purinilytica]KNF07060.1 acetyltransferase, GNAT family [Gottschalkia purinilytica]